MRARFSREIPKEEGDKFAINEEIKAREVRVIGADGAQLGILKIEDARRIADEAGVDLVEVAPEARPPVCRLLDYGKLKYREQKKAAEARKHSASQQIKELRLRYSTDKHDLETKVRKAREFLGEGDRVKFSMRFRGREVAYKELGEAVYDKVVDQLSDVAAIEQRTGLIGNSMTLSLVPKGQVIAK